MNTALSLVEGAAEQIDLAEASQQKDLYDLAEAMLALSDVEKSELERIANEPEAPLVARIAYKLVRSRTAIESIEEAVNVGVVFAMWGEQNRLREKAVDNPNGEDALRMKLDQLDWACNGSNVSWTLYAVDDGCPHGSGRLAADIAAGHRLGDRVKVLSLSEQLPAASGPLAGLASADDSRKGGAVICGAQAALKDGVDAVIYTDADNSVHLGQVGLLLETFVNERAGIVLGNRKHRHSVLVKQEARWGVGIKLLRHMQRMVGDAIFSRNIQDTQAAFKLYERSVLEEVLERRTVFDFSFDTDWILAAIAIDEPLYTVPFAFIDSAAESASIAQGPMTTWEGLLKGLVKQVRAHGVAHNQAMCAVIDAEIATAADLELLIDRVPSQLVMAADAEFGDPELMSPQAVGEWIQACKQEQVATQRVERASS